MRAYLLEFMKRLEFLCPPPPRCHHAITFAQYGSDETGWEEKLALQVNIDGTFRCIFLDGTDFNSGATDLANKVAEFVRNPQDSDQLGVSAGRYI